MDVKRLFGSILILFEDSFQAGFLFCARPLWSELQPQSQTLPAAVIRRLKDAQF